MAGKPPPPLHIKYEVRLDYMNNGMQVFENSDFGKVRVVERDGEPWFVAADVCSVLDLSNPTIAVSRLDEDERAKFNLGRQGDATIVNEPGLYTLVLGSRKPEAKAFKRWITHEVIPTIRKTGAYFTRKPDSYMIDDPIERAKRWIEEAQERLALQETVNEQRKEIEYKENIIIGFVEDIDLATKRQRINQIIKHNVRGGALIAARWEMLYKEFEMKYHVNLKARMESDTYANIKPKLKNKMDLIDRGMGMMAELFEIACKLFENDVDELKKEWDVTCVPHVQQANIACC